MPLEPPEAFRDQYHLLLINEAMHPDQYGFYRKWLRDRPDFRKKYAHSCIYPQGLNHFLENQRKKPGPISAGSSPQGCGTLLLGAGAHC